MIRDIKIVVLVIITFTAFTSKAQQNPNSCDCPTVELIAGEEYVLSAWSRESTNVNEVLHYENPKIEVIFVDTAENVLATYDFFPEGAIIETWQKMEGVFKVPESYANVIFRLRSLGNQPVYFDDIRVHPFNGNMKSFVYDPTSLRLVAELDENNYSTFYEYDSEGGLVRIKKETERGVYTIQETRSKTAIQQ